MTARPSGRVLVLGSDTRSFLAVVRSLGRRRLSVHAASDRARTPAFRSRYITQIHSLPSAALDQHAWVRALVALLQREQFDFVIPCDDPSLIPLQLHRAALPHAEKAYLLSPEAFAVTRSKIATTQLARACGVPVPRECVVRTDRDFDAALAALPLPLLVKPEMSVRTDALAAKQHVRLARTAAEARQLVATLIPHGPVQLQEHFPGRGVGLEVLAWEGRVLYAFQHERLHEPLTGGGSSYRVSAPLDPALLGAASQIIERLRYSGVAMVEFKGGLHAGVWALLEINGRFWGSLPLAIAAGADFPYYLYQVWVEGRREFPPGYRVGLFARNWARDVPWMWHNLIADRHDPLLLTRPIPSVLKEFFNIVTLRERSDTLTLDDPRPGLFELAGLIRKPIAAAWMRLKAAGGRALPGGPN